MCDTDILLNKVHLCATVCIVCDYMHRNIWYRSFFIQKDRFPVRCIDESRVGECCVLNVLCVLIGAVSIGGDDFVSADFIQSIRIFGICGLLWTQCMERIILKTEIYF
jgi:hypothetical protein